jgi:hypothetical protein
VTAGPGQCLEPAVGNDRPVNRGPPCLIPNVIENEPAGVPFPDLALGVTIRYDITFWSIDTEARLRIKIILKALQYSSDIAHARGTVPLRSR